MRTLSPVATHFKSVLFAVALVGITAPAYGAAAYMEDWIGFGNLGGWSGGTAGTILSNPGAGGNPGGYLVVDRPNATAEPGTSAPEATGNFLGTTWTASLDLRLLDDSTIGTAALRFRYNSPAFNGWRFLLGPVSSDWQTFTINFDPSWSDAQAIGNGWDTDLPGGAGSVSWSQTLSDVFRTSVRLENGINPIHFGIDNFSLIPDATVPLPGAAPLLMFGSLLLVASRLRRQ